MNTASTATSATDTRRSLRSWARCLAASVALFALLSVACSSGDDLETASAAEVEPTVAPTQVAPTVSAATEPAAESTMADRSEGAGASPAKQGKMTGRCNFGNGGPNPESGRLRASQDCIMSSDAVLPIDPEQNLFIEFLDDGPSPTFGDPIIGFSRTNHVYGGYTTGAGDGRFVGSVLGTGDYAEAVIHIVGHSPGDGSVAIDWYVGDGPQPFGAAGNFEETVEIRIECVPGDVPAGSASDVTAVETCTYASDDQRLSLAPTSDVIRTIDAGASGEATDVISYYSAETDTGVVRGGLVDDNGIRRWAGVVDGLGEIDDVVHEVGWVQTDESGLATGVILVSFGLKAS